jgi:hypothetical protein
MWRYLKKRRAIRSYRTKLATKLRQRYGREKHYSPEQVRSAAVDSSVSVDWLCYAYALYCTQEAFDEHHRVVGEQCDYVAMRGELMNVTGVSEGELSAFDVSSGDSFDLGDFGGGADFGGGD